MAYISKFTGQEIDTILSNFAKAIYPTLNCPNCGAPIRSGVCEYCGTQNYNPKLDHIYSPGTGGCGGSVGNGGQGVVYIYGNKVDP